MLRQRFCIKTYWEDLFGRAFLQSEQRKNCPESERESNRHTRERHTHDAKRVRQERDAPLPRSLAAQCHFDVLKH